MIRWILEILAAVFVVGGLQIALPVDWFDQLKMIALCCGVLAVIRLAWPPTGTTRSWI